MSEGLKKKVLGQFGKAALKPVPAGKEEKYSLRKVQKCKKGLPSLLKSFNSK